MSREHGRSSYVGTGADRWSCFAFFISVLKNDGSIEREFTGTLLGFDDYVSKWLLSGLSSLLDGRADDPCLMN